MMDKISVIEKINGALEKHCENPSEELRKLGQATIEIADALEGKSIAEARAIMKSVETLLEVSKA